MVMRKATSPRKIILVALMVVVFMSITPRATSMVEYEVRITERINVIRSLHGLRMLKVGECAETCAAHWARTILRRKVLMHQKMSYMMNKCDAEGAGEILGAGNVDPKRMVRLWMNSPPHRKVILNPRYTHIGVGAVRDITGHWWVAVEFLYKET